MKRYTLPFTLFLAFFIFTNYGFSQCNTGETEVTIDVLTDNYGYEAYWELVPGGNNCGTGTIFSGGNTTQLDCLSGGGTVVGTVGNGYDNNLTITEGPWCLTTGSNYTIHFVDDYGDGGINFEVNIAGYPMYQFSGSDLGNQFYFSATEPLTYNAGISAISTASIVPQDEIFIKGKIINTSSSFINSIVLNYSINNGSSVSETLSSLNIAPYDEYYFKHSTSWNPIGVGYYDLKVWIGNINGNTDMNHSNDTMMKTITILEPVPDIIDFYLTRPVTKNVIASSSDQISVPRDLDFHPDASKKELWVILKSNEADGGITAKISNAGEVNQSILVQEDQNNWHFMSLPTGIAFGDSDNFCTSPGVFDANHDGGEPFTGPTLWSSDPSIYAQPSGGNGSHIDMLHESPYSMGVAHEIDNVYWVNDGNSNTVVRYDFKEDHGPGASYHGDAITRRYSGLGLTEDPTHHVPSHLILDKNTDVLYMVDSENDRILSLDINTGYKNANLPPHEAMVEFSEYLGYTSSVVINGGINQPCGIDYYKDNLLVSEYTSGDIIIFNKTSGTELGRIVTGSPGVMGLKIGPDGHIWYVNAQTNEVVRLEVDLTGVSVNELTKNEFQIYPNPNKGDFNLTFNDEKDENFTFSVHNTLGEEIPFSVGKKNNNSYQIRISSDINGTYFLKMNSEKSTLVQKIILAK